MPVFVVLASWLLLTAVPPAAGGSWAVLLAQVDQGNDDEQQAGEGWNGAHTIYRFAGLSSAQSIVILKPMSGLSF